MDDDQEKLLEQSSQVVKSSGYQMQKSSDTNNTPDVIKHAVDLISELKSSSMSPKTYYELYMQVFDHLSRLESYFMQEYRRNGKISELFEKVQHVTSILPRLYLLITVGSVYINTNEISAKDMLKDLMEMVKGVQHPIRGLFLRYYLNKMCKDKLPDSLSDSNKGDVTDSIDFLLNNFSEMCRLWVRMQHTGGIKDKTKREKERNDLKVTVGENIVRLSSLEGVTLDIYITTVLPKSLEVILSSKDAIAQQYLMDCFIQAFPDTYHLNTLNSLLETTTQLQPSVEIKGIFINLLNRLSDFAGETDLEIVETVDIFNLIKTHVDKLLSEHSSEGETSKFLQLFVAFLRLSLKCYPDNIEHVSTLLSGCVELIEKENSGAHLDSESLDCISKMLSSPLESVGLAVLGMPSFPKLMSYLHFQARKKVALKIVKSVVSSKTILSSTQIVSTLLEYITSLVEDINDTIESDPYEFEEEQEYTARLVHLVYSKDLVESFDMLTIFKEKFASGGSKRQIYTYPALIFAFIKFSSRLGESEVKLGTVVNILYTLVQKISKINPELGYKLSLQCASCINVFDIEKEFEEVAYEFCSNALVSFQDDLQDFDIKFSAIKIIAATYASLTCFDQENSFTLYANCAQFASKTLRKDEQVEGNMLAAKLFWNRSIQNSDKVMEYLQRGYQIAKAFGDNGETLKLVEVLNNFVYLALSQVPDIDENSLDSLVDIVKKQVKDSDRTYFNATASYIRQKQSQGKFRPIST